MSAVVSPPSVEISNTEAATPQSESLRRLVGDCSGYLDVDAGETVPVDEVEKQAAANGYTKREFQQMLDEEGLASVESLVVPERDGSIFGEMWNPDGGLPMGENGEIVSSFSDWLQSKRDSRITEYADGEYQHMPEHSFTRKAEAKKFARVNDIDRHFQQNHDTFSTVMLTFVAEKDTEETTVEHASKFYPQKLMDSLRYYLKREDVWSEAAGVNLLAPKHPKSVSQSRPMANHEEDRPVSHAHTFLWLPGEVDTELFQNVIDRHIETVEGATEEDHPYHESIKVQVHDSDSIESDVSEIEGLRGATTSLTKEIGNNLPLLQCKIDAEGTPDYITDWSAYISAGSDEKHSTKGIQRYRRIGNFTEYADEMKEQRQSDGGLPMGENEMSPEDSPFDESYPPVDAADSDEKDACATVDTSDDSQSKPMADYEETEDESPSFNFLSDSDETDDIPMADYEERFAFQKRGETND